MYKISNGLDGTNEQLEAEEACIANTPASFEEERRVLKKKLDKLRKELEKIQKNLR